jgi:hypothetical protein
MKKEHQQMESSSKDCAECHGLGLITVYYTGGLVTIPCDSCRKSRAERQRAMANAAAAPKRKTKRPQTKFRRG